MTRTSCPRSIMELAVVVLVLLLVPRPATPIAVIVRNGFEFHASLTSPSVNCILVADNVTFDLATCPFPSSPAFPATQLDRNITVSSLSPESVAAAATSGVRIEQEVSANAAAAAASGPFSINCSYLNGRFTLKTGYKVVFDSVVLINCRTTSVAGFISKEQGSTVVLNNTVDDQGSVCFPLFLVQSAADNHPRPPDLPGLPPNRSDQVTALAPPGSSWCAWAAAGANSKTTPQLPPQVLPLLLTNHSSYSLCQQQAVLMGDVARMETAVPYQLGSSNTSANEPHEPFTLIMRRTAFVCRQPISIACLQARGAEFCMAEAYRAVNPDEHPPCPALDLTTLLTCFTTPAYSCIVVLSDLKLNATVFPPTVSENPPVISRNISLESDPRGPRMVLDCALLTDRLQVPAGVTVTAKHIVLSNCSIGAEKPLTLLRFDQGSQLIVNDSFILQPNGLCLPQEQQLAAFAHESRPADIPGAQSYRLSNESAGWCATNPNTRTPTDSAATAAGTAPLPGSAIRPTVGADSNSSYSKLPPLPTEYANRTGLGPTYAATLDQPARAAFYTHPTWPRYEFCSQQVLLLVDYAYYDRFGWTLPANVTQSANLTFNRQQQQQQLPPALLQRLGNGYNSSLPVHYINSTVLCQQPSAACSNKQTNGAQSPCLLAEYAKLDPDTAAGYVPAGAPAASGRNYGVSVVLPAVLGCVGGALLLGAVALGVLAARRRSKHGTAQAAAPMGDQPSTPTSRMHPASLIGLIFGTTPSSHASTNPGRRLLTTPGTSPRGTYASSPASSSQQRSPGGGVFGQTAQQMLTHDDIRLSVLIGGGSYGRVYSGVWKGIPVAVKVISHSSEDDERISRELSLSLSFDHPNLVRTLHYARIKIAPQSKPGSLGMPGSVGDGSVFLPDGAVGVFDLPSSWAVVKSQSHASTVPTIDTETWIVMDIMDRGTLAAAVKQGAFERRNGTTNAAMLLRRCADVAAGVSYLHSRNVCHGDLKCENVLLRNESHDPDRVMAAVADFGLSRALAFGQSHLSTRRYGTVTHMPPELLVAGKLTPAADIYSFGIMMWEMVSCAPPFAGLHHGEVIHRVVTEDLRPGPWPADVIASLPSGYVRLTESCWSRQAVQRPSAQEVLQQLLTMLEQVEPTA